MSFTFLKTCATAAVVSLGLAGSASAATFDVFGGATLLGSFEADAMGGQVTSASFTVSGIVFDAIDPADIPEYRSTFNDLTGPGATIFANFTNSMAMGGCGVGDCLLFFEKISIGPPDVFTYQALNIATATNLPGGGGNYEIKPAAVVPLPATALLLLSGLGLLSLRRRA